jgi:pimeloyl-ACP methyl ester carboxylesterase
MGAKMELKTVQTHHVPVRYLEGGSGPDLIFLHGAAGAAVDDPFVNALAAKFHVYAPMVPGYGDSEECPEIRDMLDFTQHTWDVVEALGLKDPILVGHSMGGLPAHRPVAPGPDRPAGPVG